MVSKDLREYPETLDRLVQLDPRDKMDLRDSQEQLDQRVAPEVLVVRAPEDCQAYREQPELPVPEVTPDPRAHSAIPEELERLDRREPVDHLDPPVISGLPASLAHRVSQELLDQLGLLALLGSEERTEILVTPDHLALQDLRDLLDSLDHTVLWDQRETRDLLALLARLGQVAIRVHRV